MRKHQTKLRVSREVLRSLTTGLDRVVGGVQTVNASYTDELLYQCCDTAPGSGHCTSGDTYVHCDGDWPSP